MHDPPASGRRYALRLQVTWACDLKCPYCRPDGRVAGAGRRLSAENAVRWTSWLCELGVGKVRLTGGEPLLHPEILEIVRGLRGIEKLNEVALTTNGQRLERLAEPLARAGLGRVNVHIDSLDSRRYHRLMGGELTHALAGLKAAKDAGLSPKVNVVVQAGENDEEIEDFVALAARLGIVVRFIELMDTGVASSLVRRNAFSARALRQRLTALGASEVGRLDGAPAITFRFPTGTEVGVIGSESEPFCDSCNRLRVSGEGLLRTCLYATGGLNLADPTFAWLPDAERSQRISEHLRDKRPERPITIRSRGQSRRFSMSEIGG